jgi:hypothetical protein
MELHLFSLLGAYSVQDVIAASKPYWVALWLPIVPGHCWLFESDREKVRFGAREQIQ